MRTVPRQAPCRGAIRFPRTAPASGFTLVEVLVALLIMGVVAAMSWQGIDSIVRTRDISAQKLEQGLRLQSVITQWETDLQEVQDSGIVPALQFDGASLRLTRRAADGLQLIVWSLRGGTWTRWASPSATTGAAFQDTWMRSQQLVGNETGQLRVLGGIESWQLYFWRGNAWSNAQSSAGTATPGQPGAPVNPVNPLNQPLPQGVRLLLKFSEGGGFAGTLTRDVRMKL